MTIKDIAKIAGVSHSTVSRSLHNHPSISEARKKQIHRIARKTKFEFNMHARGLRGEKTDTVGIIVHKNIETNFFLSNLLSKISQSEENNFLDYIIAPPSKGTMSNIQRLIRKGKVDGFILIHPEIPHEDYGFLTDNKVPFVHLHFKPKKIDYREHDYYLTDHEHGGYAATRHLIQTGRNRIISLTHGRQDIQFIERSSGFCRAMKDYGLPNVDKSLIHGDCSYEFGKHFVYECREQWKHADAIFAQADITAIGIVHALREMGVKIPDDIAIIGYDDIQMGQYLSPSLSTIHQPTENMDHQACVRIQELFQQQRLLCPVQKIFKPELVVRESAPYVHTQQDEQVFTKLDIASSQNTSYEKKTADASAE